jgi:purine-binding chemotaxis protein CheW
MSRQLCTFYVGGCHLGLDVLTVQEILPYSEPTPVPLTQEVLAGLINLRGEVVPALSLRRRLGVDAEGGGAERFHLILRHEGGVASLLVDEIGEVLIIEDSAFEAPPSHLQGALRRLMDSVAKLEDHLLMVLDAACLLPGGVALSARAKAVEA